MLHIDHILTICLFIYQRGEVVYAGEDDVHFPSLNVKNTLTFSTAARTPHERVRPTMGESPPKRANYINEVRDALARTLGLTHTYNTPVGDAQIRGVSGGEKKRVSLVEAMSLHARIMLLDNPSRGLDASTAVELAAALQTLCRVTNTSCAASMYQAGEPVYKHFDRVVVLNAGHVVYFGRADQAVQYFVDMGFEQFEHQTSADFLVAVTDANARKIRPGYEQKVPITAEQMAEYWNQSSQGHQAVSEADDVIAANAQNDAASLTQTMHLQKEKLTTKKTPFMLNWGQQIALCIKRRAQVQIGDVATPIVMFMATLIQGLINGSVFYQMPKNSSGFFSRGGVLFFLLLFNSFMAQTEVTIAYAQRPIIIRHNKFALAHPSADAFANTLLDIPIRSINVTIFTVVIYFLTGLSYSADQFFICWSTVLLVTVIMVAIFRSLAAVFRHAADATLVSGLVILWFAIYAGYVVPRTSMVIWWKWLSYCNPVSFAFEILMTNEARRLIVPCSNLVPPYPDASLDNKVCPVAGSIPGTNLVNGLEYMESQYTYRWDNRRRNVGILIGYWVFFVFAYAILTEFQADPSKQGGVMVFRRGVKNTVTQDELNARAEKKQQEQELEGTPSVDESIIPATQDIFSWRDVTYTVQIKGGEKRRLLDHVTGYVQPGKMTALMGESGAGKTTLLNVLAQRADVGVITGDFTVNGSPLPNSFQQQTGYCQQQDTHLHTQTVREALQFSALLRQSSGTRQEKLEYVEEVIRLLDMEPFAEALVGKEGEGLSVEQRKRLTIAVELAAKPKLLLFLDEPTSGMDSLAAWSIVRFIKKLAYAGQSILCTIHQPSGELFAQFDRLILLKRGGQVVFSGDIHNNERTCGRVLDYFEGHSGRTVGHGNPAEFMLECIGAGATATTDKDWAELYNNSPLSTEMRLDVDKIMARRHDPQFKPSDDPDLSREFAAGYGEQLIQLVKRTAVHYWRNPAYIIGKLGLYIVAGLFIGSSFWGQGSKQTVASLQNKLFATFLGLVVVTSLAQQLMPEYLELRGLFQSRESPSKMYSWIIMIASFLIIETPLNWFGGTLFWIPWNFMVKVPHKAFTWFWYAILFQCFWTFLAVTVQNMGASNSMIGGVIFSLLFSVTIVFSGVVQPPPLMPTFWKAWMTHLSPFTYYIEAVTGALLTGNRIVCAPKELATIHPPANQTCDQYLSNFSSPFDDPNPTGKGYYVSNPDGTCGYCQYRYQTEFLTNDSLNANMRFRDIGIFCAYIAFNFVLAFVMFYLFFAFKPSKIAAGVKSRKQAKRDRAEREQFGGQDTEKQAADDA